MKNVPVRVQAIIKSRIVEVWVEEEEEKRKEKPTEPKTDSGHLRTNSDCIGRSPLLGNSSKGRSQQCCEGPLSSLADMAPRGPRADNLGMDPIRTQSWEYASRSSVCKFEGSPTRNLNLK